MHPLDRRKIEDIFDPRKATEYRLKLDAIWQELVIAHDSAYVVEKVGEFPWDLLLEPHGYRFLRLVQRNFVLEAASIVVNVLSDESPRSLTLPGMKAWILGNCQPKVRKEVAARFDRLAAAGAIEDLLRRASQFRLEVLTDLDHALDPRVRYDATTNSKELRSLLDRTEKLCRGICIGGDRMPQTVPYSSFALHSAKLDSKSDIEHILDRLASESAVLRMPEQQPDRWSQYKQHLTKGDRKLFNQWRRRVGRAEVAF